ncbi:hypothetical protein [Ligilactobacillus ruminis]|uniref:hypothetical protein n=1 Tax=Ligilactobacillus ruminis TaxID=1623 RepID=UPI0026590FB6|nr:hypothetical protein [Ligilactobacillus ruminis]MCI5767771.1 hypothetical protein [Ligilactobacillus ruminis]MDD5958667.1 hypothetical protein [Ligilactobacillus ruminis]WKB70232.1 hypothetical protein QYH55_07405 [Ligilactobacillus ruminis]
MKKLGITLTEAGISGAPMIPMMVFVTTFIRNNGKLDYILPFVIFYSFLKIGSFTVSVFGEVNNPFRLAQFASLTIILGSVLILFQKKMLLTLDLGAFLIGLGLSVFVPMYRTVKAVVSERTGEKYQKEEFFGFILMLIFTAFLLVGSRYSEELVLSCYLFLSVITLFSIRAMVRDPSRLTAPLFKEKKYDWQEAMSAVILLALLFSLRLFKQTADVSDIFTILIIATILIFFEMMTHFYAAKEPYELYQAYFSEYMTFVILYCVFLYMGMADVKMVVLAFSILFAVNLTAKFTARYVTALENRWLVGNVMILMLMVSSVLMIPERLWLLGVAVSVYAISIGMGEVGSDYQSSGKFPTYEQQLARQKMNGVGSVIGQLILIGVMIVSSQLLVHDPNYTVNAYIHKIPSGELESVLLVTRYAGLVLLDVQGIFLLMFGKKAGRKLFVKD